MKYHSSFKTPIGTLYTAEEDGKLTHVTYRLEEMQSVLSDKDSKDKETPFLKKVRKQITEYFDKKRTEFDLPLKLYGTDFMLKDWEALSRIPYGETRSYKDIAEAIGKPKAARAVGLANNRNPVSIIIPCHRVIGADGSLTGYGGGLDKKRFLLDLERE